MLLAIDWGSTNRRAYALDRDGTVVAEERDDRGVTGVAPGGFAAEVEGIRARLGDLPMLCAGMVGSTRGWVTVPFVACPATLSDVATALHWMDDRTAIVPGLSIDTGARTDVMRGEEVQMLGAIAAGIAPHNTLLCQPGTHCKWATMRFGSVADFRTTMTGEIFALLRDHSLLSYFLGHSVEDGPAFREGLTASHDARLLSDLFGVRSSVLLQRRNRDRAASYVSGLLIGNDVREQAIDRGETVHLLADPSLGPLYGAALAEYGVRSVYVDSRAAFIAGALHLWRLADATQS